MGISVTHKSSQYQNRQRILDHVSSKMKMIVCDISMDSSYVSGGEDLRPAEIGKGMTNILAVIPQTSRGNKWGYIGNFLLCRGHESH